MPNRDVQIRVNSEEVMGRSGRREDPLYPNRVHLFFYQSTKFYLEFL